MPVTSAHELAAWNRLTEESRAVVEATLDAVNRSDGSAFLRGFADDVVFETPGRASARSLVTGLREFAEVVTRDGGYFGAPVVLRTTFFRASGEWVLTRADARRANGGGNEAAEQYSHLWRVRNGKIDHLVEFDAVVSRPGAADRDGSPEPAGRR